MASTVKISNISSKAAIKEIEDFFTFCGRIERINLTSDGNESQTAYVTFADQDSVRVALLLSGSTILDQEVFIAACSDLETEALTAEPATESPQAQMSPLRQSRPRAINRVQEIVRTMLSKGFSLGKDTIRRAHSLDEKSKIETHGDALKEIRNGSLDRQRSKDSESGDSAPIREEVSNPENGQDKHNACNDTSCNTKGNVMGTSGDNSDKNDDVATQQGKWGSNNVRTGMQICYKHVCAINEKLQIGQRTMSVVATAQQGVAHASSAVANTKLVSTGGGWVSSALSRVSLRASNASPHLNRDNDDDSSAQQHEQVQLTEMTTLPGRRFETE